MVYTDTPHESNKFTRIFKVDNLNESELVWHRDYKNRTVEIVQSGNWKFQFEDELPISLTDGLKLEIGKEVYHRILKGDSDLIILIEETDD